MFGIKNKPKKKTVRKVSNGAKKTVRKVSRKKVQNVINKKVVRPKKGALKIGGKYFDSPKDVAAYYRTEGDKVKKAMKKFKVDQAEGYLGVSKNNLRKILTQKKKLGLVAQDLEEHKNVLNSKIVELNSKKDKGESHKRSVKTFVDKMKSLEVEAKKLLDTREELIHKEAEIISEMKKLAKLAQRDLDLTDVKTAKELANFEMSKETILVMARELLSEEGARLFADNVLLDGLDKKAINKISELNSNLAQLHGAKKETLKKRNILEISESETREILAQTETNVKKLEEKYQALLKK